MGIVRVGRSLTSLRMAWASSLSWILGDGSLDGRREEGLRAALLEAGDVVADRPVRDTVAGTVLFTESFAFLQGQGFIGEGFDELEDSGAFFEAGVRKALPIGFSHAADLLDSRCQRFTSDGSAIGMHDRWKSWKSSRPGPSQSSGRSDAATVEPRSPRLSSRKHFHKRLRSTKRFVPGEKVGTPDWLGAAAITSARIGSLAPAAARRARMCFRAVRGSTQPSAMQAASVEPAPIPPFEEFRELLTPEGTSRNEVLRQYPFRALPPRPAQSLAENRRDADKLPNAIASDGPAQRVGVKLEARDVRHRAGSPTSPRQL